nr:hypothetical protein [Tanacetum cinerariifolium]
MREFYRTHPSEKSTKSEAKSWARDEDGSNNDHESSSKGSEHDNENGDNNTQSDNEKALDSEQETNENETSFKFDKQENKEKVKDDDEEEDDFVKTLSNSTPTDDEDETKKESIADDKAEGDKDQGMDDTTNLLYDDVDVRLNDPVHADEETIQKENAEIVSSMDVPIHHEVPSSRTSTLLTVPVSVITESSRVYTINILQSLQSFTSPPPLLPTPPPTTKATNPLSTLLDFASVF